MNQPWWRKLFNPHSAVVGGSRSAETAIENYPYQLGPEVLRGLVKGIFSTHPDELTCGQCFGQVDRFAEIKLVGKNPAEAMPLVQDHLDRCRDCKEEFGALLEALQAIA